MLDLEVPAADWRPVDPDLRRALPGVALFLDGVRRIDSRVWVHGSDPQPGPGIAASLAAGLVACDGTAQVVGVRVDRGLFTAAPEATDTVTPSASYPPRRVAGPR